MGQVKQKERTMRYVFLVLGLVVMVGGLAYAANRYFMTSAGVIDYAMTTTPTIVVDATIYYKGVTVGDMVQIRESNGAGAPGTILTTIVADTANGNKRWTPPVPLTIDGGIYMDVTLTGGVVGVNLLYEKRSSEADQWH